MGRLAAGDRLMLWPDEFWPQDIGALAILDGAGRMLGPDGQFRVGEARRAVEARLPLVPRFRQVLHVPPHGLGGPLWTDAPAFDPADHVRVADRDAVPDLGTFTAAARSALQAFCEPVSAGSRSP